MTSIKFILNFSWKLVAALLITLASQILIYNQLELIISFNALLFSNIFNFFMALLAVFLIYKLRYTHTQSLGYIFLLSTLFKFLGFYLFLSPILNEFYSETNRFSGFMLFFTSYVTALIVEIRCLIKLLNEL
tara:strand:- start:1787 stop:2182 length:396 start_codon:yes stop_codon:yes gene_type:complete